MEKSDCIRFICPQCKIKLSESGNKLVCSNGCEFRINSEGIPLLRGNIDEISEVPIGGDDRNVETVLKKSGFLRLVQNIISANYIPYPLNFCELIADEACVLNIGSGMTTCTSGRVTNLDFFNFPQVDIVADARSIPYEDKTFDVVISEFMIEHVDTPVEVCREIERVTRPGGKIYISYPFIHSYHSFPDDFFRYSYTGVQKLFGNSKLSLQGVLSGPACYFLTAISDFFSFFFPKRLQIFGKALGLCIFFPVKYLDLFFNRQEFSKKYAVTLYAVFEKQ